MGKYFLQVGALTLGISIVFGAAVWNLRASNETARVLLEKISFMKDASSVSDHFFQNHALFILMGSFLIANAVLFFINLLFVEPQRAPIDNAHEIHDLLTASVPPIEHLSDAFFVCPNVDQEAIRTQLTAENVRLSAPATDASFAMTSKESS
ncbi:MAG: hypothetical protein ACOY3I_02175 [Verrucomicrobiota bacterium]